MSARLHRVKDHGVMPWTTTHDPGEFVAAAGGFVRSRLVEHNVILTITARLPRAGRPGPGEPPQQRGHGYGTALTAAVTRHAIETGASEVLFFTDATNPVTNSIYQRFGYRPAEDRLILTFT
jgi:GNAT superfamily N-acetyltransferase